MNNMNNNKHYVSSDMARKLKDKNYPLIKVYKQDGNPVLFELPFDDPNWQDCEAWYIPTIYEVIEYFRDIIYIYIVIDKNITIKNSWYYKIYINDDANNIITQQPIENKTYEQAACDAIYYILNNLM